MTYNFAACILFLLHEAATTVPQCTDDMSQTISSATCFPDSVWFCFGSLEQRKSIFYHAMGVF